MSTRLSRTRVGLPALVNWFTDPTQLAADRTTEPVAHPDQISEGESHRREGGYSFAFGASERVLPPALDPRAVTQLLHEFAAERILFRRTFPSIRRLYDIPSA